MENIETTRMSSRGQVVIPQDIRERIGASDGTVFAVLGTKDTIVLKKIDMPEKQQLIKDLEMIAKHGRDKLEKKRIKESDMTDIVHSRRGAR